MSLIEKIKKYPLIVRIVFALITALCWALLAVNFQTGIVILYLRLDWLISALVLSIIYMTFFGNSKE